MKQQQYYIDLYSNPSSVQVASVKSTNHQSASMNNNNNNNNNENDAYSANNNNNNAFGNYKHSQYSSKMHNFKITSLLDEDEQDIPEEKMHSPRTPYGSVPDATAISNSTNKAHFSYPPPESASLLQTPSTPIMESMSRNISTSSFDSSYNETLYNAPCLSATSSINRSVNYSAAASPVNTPRTSPPQSPIKGCYDEAEEHKRFVFSAKQSISEDRDDEKEEEKKSMETKNNARRNIAVALQEFTEKFQENQKNNNNKVNYARYEHGAGTYSGRNSNGTATPASLCQLSRSSSLELRNENQCGAYSSGNSSACDIAWDPNKQENIFIIEADIQEPQLTPLGSVENAKLLSPSDDEMETPVPKARDCENNAFNFELPKFEAKCNLDQIVEDVATPQIITEGVRNLLSPMHEYQNDESDDRQERMVMIDEDDDIELELPHEDDQMDEDPLYYKRQLFQSSHVLFLDVDGVLLTTKEQKSLNRDAIKFNDNMTQLMTKLYHETHCDIVVSSTWQFHESTHLNVLVAYLCEIGWERNKIHTLMELLPTEKESALLGHNDANHNANIHYNREWYESSPYCASRARGIQKIVSLYHNQIDRWCSLDDLPLNSSKYVCVPHKNDLSVLVNDLSEAYFQHFPWRYAQKSKLMVDIKYCVKYALTQLNNCLFSSQSYRFGFEYDNTIIYYQADAIAKLIKMSYEVRDSNGYNKILQSLMSGITEYCRSHLCYQGDPYISPYLVQTNQEIGLTLPNIEKAIWLLTYNEKTKEITV